MKKINPMTISKATPHSWDSQTKEPQELNDFELYRDTDGVLEAAIELWLLCQKPPVRGMRATQINKSKAREFIMKLKKLDDKLGDRFDALYPKTAAAFDTAITKL